nr:hypothetical protein [Streptomyces sp. 150FB]
MLSQLHDLDPALPIRLAITPDRPFAHLVGASIVISNGVVFIAENGQEGYLPTGVRDLLAWN